MIKLKPGEGERLATLLLNTSRPRSEAEAREVEAWIKRLQGGRS